MKNFRVNWSSPTVGAVVGTFLVLMIGLLCLFSTTSLSNAVSESSYDWSFELSSYLQPDTRNSPVVIIYVDEDSYKSLDQQLNKPWDRSIHAKLLNYLKEDGALAVVFDVVFSDPGSKSKADAEFEQAIRRNGKVVLAADYSYSGSSTGEGSTGMYATTMPIDRFLNASAGVGLESLDMEQDEDFMVRRHISGFPSQNIPSLSWATARVLQLPVAKEPKEFAKERWVHYYGAAGTMPHYSYARLFYPNGVPRGAFHDKIVYVGARPITTTHIERRDELRNPYNHWGWGDKSVFMPAVEVHATETLNLIRGDSLRRLPPMVEATVLVACALFFGVFLFRFRPFAATCVAILGALVFLLFSIGLFACGVWFPWLVVIAFQLPVALLWCVVFKSLEWYTHRLQMEEEQRAAHERIREQASLLDKAQDAILVHDLAWRVTYWNKSAERLYGLSTSDAIDKNVADLLASGTVETMETAKTETLQHGEWIGELKQKSKSNGGAALVVQSRWTLVRDDAGAPKSILVINTDITEKKKLESQFLRAQRMESIGTLAGGIAHDLNNVLSPIVMGTELLLKVEKDEKRLKLLRTMSSSASRGADMVKQVLTFARGLEGERTPMQMTHIVKEMQKIAHETFPKSITMETRIAPDAAMIRGDATQIHQILLNLCVNARDAMPEGGKITAEITNVTLDESLAKKIVGAKSGKYLVLSVSDTGMGIPSELQDKIFEPFFTTKEVGKGTGLGLSTVISIIKGHGGFLELISDVGSGTTFRIYFPAVAAPALSVSATTSLNQLQGNNELILIIDDETSILEVTAAVLSQSGYRVMAAVNGADAMALVQKHSEPFKIAVVDMMMPVMDGPRTIRALKNIRPDMKFIAVSGLQQSDEIRKQLASYGVPFFAKPVTSEKLLLALKKELSDSASAIAAAA